MKRFDGKFVFISGGSSGIGLATAKMFEREGARVAINGSKPEKIADALASLSATAIGIPGRVESLADLDDMVARLREEFGRLDVMVLSAGVNRAVGLKAMTEADFDQHFGVNVKGVIFAVQKAAPLMPPGSSIILISSGAAELGRVDRSLYAASKAAVRSLARSLAAELVHSGIRVNAVSPGPILTPLTMSPERSAQEQADLLAKMVPIGRVGVADDVASAIVFLASDQASFVLGAELAVDGGWVQLHQVPPKRAE